jgi:Double-GTPase 1
VNIVMLGHSNAGKTTYMTMMYSFMNEGVYGFRVRAEDDADHSRLTTAASAVRTGRYPPPSEQRHEYRFQLRHADTPIYAFRWRDYRGGALTERNTSRQAAELRQDLLTADGIVVFTDAHELLTDPRAHRKIRALMLPVTEALTERQSVTPLVIALTKIDLVPPDSDTGRFWLAFEPLIDAVRASPIVYGSLMPVSCGPQPRNVIHPVLWCLYHGIVSHAAQLDLEVQQAMNKARLHETRDTFGNRVWSRMAGRESERTKGVLLRLEAYRRYRFLEPLVEPASKLEQMLDGVPWF